MSNTTTVTLRIPVELKRDLDDLAEATERSASWLAARALQAWVDENRWQLAAIREGIAQADAGDLVDHADVARWLDQWGTDGEREPPR